MTYAAQPATYDKDRYVHSAFWRWFICAFWVSVFVFGMFIGGVAFAMMKFIGIINIEWPWEVLQKGVWSGNCPACREEVLTADAEKAIEGLVYKCECGAHYRLMQGCKYSYVSKVA